jgi:hypothetical protein
MANLWLKTYDPVTKVKDNLLLLSGLEGTHFETCYLDAERW